MPPLNKWHRAVMREDLLGLSKGDRVFIIKSTQQHTNQTLNPSFWIAQPKLNAAYQVAAAEFGPNLSKLLKINEPLEDERQEQLTDMVKKVLKDCVYTPKGQRLMAKYMDAVIKFRESKRHVHV